MRVSNSALLLLVTCHTGIPAFADDHRQHGAHEHGKAFEGQLFDAVWVSGTMRVERLSSELADAGYRLENAVVAPFE